MKQSESLSNLAQALAKVQGQLRPAEQNASNPFFKSKYADLGSVIAAARNLMAENGLSIVQFPGLTMVISDSIHYATLTTTLMHESGEWMSQELTMPLAKVDPQGYGSAITYARRYAFAAVLGIVTGEDDDGNLATGRPASTNGQEKKLTPPASFIAYCQKELGYTSPEHVKSTMKLLGFKSVPNDSEGRKHIFAALKFYRANRDDGMSQEDALQAMADAEVEDA